MIANQKFIVFVTGASGVGKTTLINKLKEKHFDKSAWQFEHFDSINVPSSENMIKEFGSIEEWQRVMTHEWVEKLINKYQDKEVIIFEGQVNLDFIKEAFEKNNFKNYSIVLIDANEEKMIERLSGSRNQPELANQDMKNWLGFLRKQAKELNAPTIDTSDKSKDDIVIEFEQVLRELLEY